MPHQIKTQQVFLSCQFWNWSGKFDYWWGDVLGFRRLDRYRIKLNQPVPSSSRQEQEIKFPFYSYRAKILDNSTVVMYTWNIEKHEPPYLFIKLFSAKWFLLNLTHLSSRLTNAAVKIIAMDIDKIKLFDCSSTLKLLKFEKLCYHPLPRAISVRGTKC